jgi:hypothetical protein
MAAKPVIHLPVFAGASAVLYAGSLALVTALQSDLDAELAATRAPMLEASRQAATEGAQTISAVKRASDALSAAVARYGAATDASLSLDAALSALAEQVSRATGAAARLPATISLPAAPSRVGGVVVAPPTQATTGASGG